MQEIIDKENFASHLLRWYQQQARILPWRDKPTPYRVWVSEIMLQQTRVQTVVPYFERFMKALPDIQALAQAPADQLLKLWEGLGYYSRARNLQSAAQEVMARFDQELPTDLTDLRSLPGIGDYTAGAIASIAFNMPVPAVDGNVLRVFSRLTLYVQPIDKPAAKKAIGQAVKEVLPKFQAREFNQAVMELGALVCLPGKQARCSSCPVQAHCQAYLQGQVESLPIKTPPKKRMQQMRTLLVITWQNCVALQRRPASGLLGGLWEYPSVEGNLSLLEVQALADERDFFVQAIESLGEARHIFTHLEWHMRGYQLILQEEPASLPKGWRWVSLEEVANRYALPSAFKVFSQRLLEGAVQLSLDLEENPHR